MPPGDEPPLALCFGEMLWDFLPDGLFVGGAPFNVAYHLRQLGVDARPLSSVGRDVLGDELIRRAEAAGLNTALVQRHRRRRTGYARAVLEETGNARFEIARETAWDELGATRDALRIARHAHALVFGSLAQRSDANRQALEKLFQTLPSQAHRVFDVNLRPPYDDLALVRERAVRSTVLKLNAAEAARLAAGEAESAGREESHARILQAESRCGIVCITAGERGAGLMREGVWSWEPAQRIGVVDTVGAGDAFLAAMLSGLLHGGLSDAELLARACRMGEWVASRRSATPAYDSSTPK